MSSALTISHPFPIPTHHHQQPNKNHNFAKTPSSSWIEQLRSHTRSGNFHEAISVYMDKTTAGHQPDNFAFPAVLKAVTEINDFKFGQQLHAAVVKLGYDMSSVTVANTLLNMYGKCGSLNDVLKMFDQIAEKDRVSWNTLIASLCRVQEWELALDMFREMQFDIHRVEPNSFTLVSMSLACSNLETRRGVILGKQVHAYSLRIADSMSFTNNSLMSMYAKLGRFQDSVSIFEIFAVKNMVSWNTMISSLSQKDRFEEAMDVFRLMIVEGMKPDGVTISSVLPACSHLELLDHGKEIHAYVLRNGGLIENSYVCSALVDMYCNCKQVTTGRRVFDGLVATSLANWNAMLAGYTQNGFYDDALFLFLEMIEFSGLFPNPTTMASVLPASVHCESFHDKESMHGYVAKMELAKDGYVQNALMDLYSRMGKVDISRNIFESIENKDTVSWNTIITGYVVCGCHEHALHMLHKMTHNNDINKLMSCKPNNITLMTLLPGCAALAALEKGKEIHAYAIRNLLASDVAVGSSLADMYAKCGCLNLSRNVFDIMPIRNVITWNVMFMAYAMHGKGDVALSLFENMVSQVQPNEVTFISLFAACSHSGLINQGRNLFLKMKDEYGVDPTEDHYGCVVDLLGRAGHLDEAHDLIKKMPPSFNKTGAWSSLLGACWIHQNVELGEIAAQYLLELEPDVASHYILLSNIYSRVGLWEKATKVRKNMIRNGVKKEPGCSWIEFDDKVHKFVAGDFSHPQSKQLHGFVERLSERLKEEGYEPDTSCVLHNVNEEEKENLLCGHSERLAIAFGLLNTPPGVPIRVAKNLRVCNDCHSATKFISKVVDREIIVRDVRRFHYFKDGKCSCRDYW